jgi:hypothetical protein
MKKNYGCQKLDGIGSGFRSKLVCLSKPVKGTDNRKDISLLRNIHIFCQLRKWNVYSTGPRWNGVIMTLYHRVAAKCRSLHHVKRNDVLKQRAYYDAL